MNANIGGNCRKLGCKNPVPFALSKERICLDHFLDEAFSRTDYSFECCRHGLPLDTDSFEWLLSDALSVVKHLEEEADRPNPEQRERLLELLLVVANFHEYIAHNSVQVQRPA